MKATTNKALALLGQVAQLNEEIMEFMFLWADADIRVAHRHASDLLGEAYHLAIENNDLKTARKIKTLSDRLLVLAEEPEEQRNKD